jgi:hypothetical protein
MCVVRSSVPHLRHRHDPPVRQRHGLLRTREGARKKERTTPSVEYRVHYRDTRGRTETTRSVCKVSAAAPA